MKLKLQILKEKDVNQSYLNWYQDDKVIRYSNNQYRSFTIEGQKKYVKNCLVSKDMDLFGIFDEDIHNITAAEIFDTEIIILDRR